MSGRDAILGRIRRSLKAGDIDGARRTTVDGRIGDSPRGIIPQRAQLPREAQVRLFVDMAERVQSSVVRLASYAELPQAVADYLRSRNLPQAIRRGRDARLDAADWSSQPQMSMTTGASDGHDLAGLSHASAGIAETGTLVMTSGQDNPTTLNFLPDYHLVVIDAADIVGDMETVMTRLRQEFGKGTLPRTVNMVTGPSRSGDIEQKILLGAHGPRALHILVIGG